MPRAFIVGNGLSLKQTNLELLKGEVCYGVNSINLIYPHTTWRPTIYIRAEEAETQSPAVYREDMRMHLEDIKCEVWANQWFIKEAPELGKYKNFHTIAACDHYIKHFDQQDSPHLWHLPLLCTFGSSVNVAIQLAVQQGYGPIYLIGCDLDYKEKHNHFDENYTVGSRSPRYNNMDILAAHMVAARSSPVKIYNAGVGGSLEAYERVKLESLFPHLEVDGQGMLKYE